MCEPIFKALYTLISTRLSRLVGSRLYSATKLANTDTILAYAKCLSLNLSEIPNNPTMANPIKEARYSKSVEKYLLSGSNKLYLKNKPICIRRKSETILVLSNLKPCFHLSLAIKSIANEEKNKINPYCVNLE